MKRRSRNSVSVFRELPVVRDSNLPALKIISEKESRKKDRIGFHGRFPLQKPRMLVRCIRACFKEETGWLRNIFIRPEFGADFFTLQEIASLESKKIREDAHCGV